MSRDDQISALERLTQLRDSGVLTPEEFETQKAQILGSSQTGSAGTSTEPFVPFYRRLWVVVCLTMGLVTAPMALLCLATGPVYRRTSNGLTPIAGWARATYAGALGLWLAAVIYNVSQGGLSEAYQANRIAKQESQAQEVAQDTAAAGDRAEQPSQVQPSQPSQTAQAGQMGQESPTVVSGQPVACGSSQAAQMVRSALEGGTNRVMGIQVLDFGGTQEWYFDEPNNIRYCQGRAELNTGSKRLGYRLYFGPSGTPLAEVREETHAFEVRIAIAKGMAEQQAAQQAQQAQQTSSGQSQASRNPALPACRSDKVRLAVIRGYVSHFNVPMETVPQDLIRALATLNENTSPDTDRIRRPIVNRGLAGSIEDTMVCGSTARDLTALGGVLYITPAGDFEGFWFGMQEPFPFNG